MRKPVFGHSCGYIRINRFSAAKMGSFAKAWEQGNENEISS